MAVASPPAAHAWSIVDVLGPQKTVGVLAVIVVGAIIGVAFLLLGSASNGISFSPSTVSCSNPVDFSTTVHLPSSVSAGDTITVVVDGRTLGSEVVSSAMTQGADGSWTSTETSTAAQVQSACTAGGATLAKGSHTEQVLDATGKVIASGTYTINP